MLKILMVIIPDDIDSNPDNEPDNDIIGGDDVTDNSNGDEDDHDPATISPAKYLTWPLWLKS